MRSDEGQLFTPYNGTGGYVERLASIARAFAEVESGQLSKRQHDVLRALTDAGSDGATWRVVGAQLNLHHGQVSGALSNLHKGGGVFMLRRTVNRCHPYVAREFRYLYGRDEVWDSPATTRAGVRHNLLEQLLAECIATPGLTDAIKQLIAKVEQHDNAVTEKR